MRHSWDALEGERQLDVQVAAQTRVVRRSWLRLAAGVAVGGGAAVLAGCGASGGKPAASKSAATSTAKSPASASKPAAKTGAASGGSAAIPLMQNPLANLKAPQAKGKVSISGKLDSSWSGAQTYTLSATDPRVLSVGSTFNTSPPMKQSKCYVQWDSHNLYVAEWREQTAAGLPITDAHANVQVYLSNSLGVFFANSDLAGNTYTVPGHYTVWGTPRGPKGDHKPHLWLRAGGKGKEVDTHPNWPIAATLSKTGYVMTMAIPWSALQAVPWKAQKGAHIKFTLLATAAAPAGKPWGQIMLVGKDDLASQWGTLSLL